MTLEKMALLQKQRGLFDLLRVHQTYDRLTEFKLSLCLISFTLSLSTYAPITSPALFLVTFALYLASATLLPTLLLTALLYALSFFLAKDYQAVIFFGIFLVCLSQLLNEWNNVVLNYHLRVLGYLIDKKYPEYRAKELKRWTYQLSTPEQAPYIFSAVRGYEYGERITWTTPINDLLNNTLNLLWIYNQTDTPREIENPQPITYFGHPKPSSDFLIQHWQALNTEKTWQSKIEAQLLEEKILYYSIKSVLIVEDKYQIYTTTWEMLNFTNLQELKKLFPDMVIWLEGNQAQWENEGIFFFSGSPTYLISTLKNPPKVNGNTTYEQNKIDTWAYQELGLPQNATQEEIKKQFQKLVKEHHPDKNKNQKDTEKYQGVIAAYHYLKNKAK